MARAYIAEEDLNLKRIAEELDAAAVDFSEDRGRLYLRMPMFPGWLGVDEKLKLLLWTTYVDLLPDADEERIQDLVQRVNQSMPVVTLWHDGAHISASASQCFCGGLARKNLFHFINLSSGTFARALKELDTAHITVAPGEQVETPPAYLN